MVNGQNSIVPEKKKKSPDLQSKFGHKPPHNLKVSKK